MASELQLKKELLSPPGDTIQETIDTIGMSQAELAERIGRPKEKLNDIIKGKEPITQKTALSLERVLGIPVSFWIKRESEYREELMRIEQQEFLQGCIDWANMFPLLDLKKLNFLPDTRNKSKLAENLLRFFQVASPKQWEQIYIDETVNAAFKISLANTSSPYAISAWLRIGEIKARKLNLPDFDKTEFKEALLKIKDIVKQQPNDFKEQLIKLCNSCGVAILFTKCLSKAPISGATWWKGNSPIIQLSGRYKTNDSFWFAFYHESGHILKHGKKEVFLENIEGTVVDIEKEKEADQFAQKHLFPEAALNELKSIFNISQADIIEFAERYNTHPAVIVGQLQHHKVLKYSQGNEFKIPIDLI